MWARLSIAALGALVLSQPAFAQKRPLGLGATQTAEAYGASLGEMFSFVCPAGDGGTAYVYGTDVYTDNSAVCKAAIHAGAVQAGRAGIVTIVMGKGAASFRGSERNGVTTSSYRAWPRSYSFTRDGAPGAITWDTVWSGVPADFTAAILVRCPAGGAARGNVWGTDVYTADSAICAAAVHAGAITADVGGAIEVRRARQSGEFTASIRNGVASQRYGTYGDAFTVKAAAAPAASPPSTTAPTACALAASIARAFGDMRANIAQQYEALAREVGAAPARDLTAQRDALLRQVEERERQNLAAACPERPLVSQGLAPSTLTPPSVLRPPNAVEALRTTSTGSVAPSADEPRMPPSQPLPSSSGAQLVSVTPASLEQNSVNVQVALTGGATSWRMGATEIDLGAGISKVAGPFFTSPTEAYIVVSVSADAAPGPRAVTVTTPLQGGREIVALPTGLNVTPPLYVVSAGVLPATILAANTTPPSTSPPAQAPPAQPPATTPPASGWYTVTLNQIIAFSMTRDNQLSLDGRGDEIYAAAYRRGYNRQTHAARHFRTPVIRSCTYGDAAGGTRIKAGTQSAAGGIRTNDLIPDGSTAVRYGPGGSARIPLTIWRGELREGIDAVALSVSVWEADGKERTYAGWVTQQARMTDAVWAHAAVQQRIAQKPTGVALLTPLEIGTTIAQNGIIAIGDRAALAVAAIASGGVLFPTNELQEILSGGSDRPIGLVRYNTSVGSDIVAPNSMVVLTRELAEAALTPGIPLISAAGLGGPLYLPGDQGFVVVNVQDRESQYGPGTYSMILQVERTTPGAGDAYRESAFSEEQMNAIREKLLEFERQEQALNSGSPNFDTQQAQREEYERVREAAKAQDEQDELIQSDASASTGGPSRAACGLP